jgi:hypothetical protein
VEPTVPKDRCGFCGKKLPLLWRLVSSPFCNTAHRDFARASQTATQIDRLRSAIWDDELTLQREHYRPGKGGTPPTAPGDYVENRLPCVSLIPLADHPEEANESRLKNGQRK